MALMIEVPVLNSLPDDQFVAALGGIYEHSDWVPARILNQRPFASLPELAAAMRDAVDQASDKEKLTLIRAHPDLAGKLARAGALTEASTREQAGLGLDRLTDEEYATFSDFNTRYREKFGFPFIICARRTTKEGVLLAFAERLENNAQQEIAEAMSQIHWIAALRLEG